MNTYDENSPILGTGTLTPDDVSTAFALTLRPLDADRYLAELHRLCKLVGFNFDLLAAQALHETANFTSHIWRTRLNPVGLGVTDGGDDGIAFKDGTDAARAHVAHMFAYAQNASVPMDHASAFLEYIELDPRWDAVSEAGWFATVRTLGDLTGKWATDPGYATKIAAKANSLVASAQKGAPMTIVAQECPIETYVVWDGPNRPGLPMNSPSKLVTHEVGNTSPGADEDMHRRFVMNGGGIHQVSFHFVVGPTKIVQLLYLDENAWHASDGYFGDGNRDGIGIEHIQIGDFNKTLAHGAWLQAELARNPRRFAIKNPAAFKQDINPENVDERMVQHNWEAPDGKNCPQFIRTRGLWDDFVQAVRVEVRKGSKPPTPEPYPIWWDADDVGPQRRESDGAVAIAFRGEVRVKGDRPINLRQGADPKAPVLRTMQPGERGIIRGTFVSAKKQRWAFVEVDGKVYRTLLRYVTPATWPTL